MEIIGQTDLEKKILQDEELIRGLEYGNPRPGHPEGPVKFHIQEILNMIDQREYSQRERNILRFLTIVHDSFKYQVDRTRPKVGENHHGWYARKFAEKYVGEFGDDAELILEILQWHDEAYLIKKHMENHADEMDKWNARLDVFLVRPIKDWLFFLEFMYHDGNTGGKESGSAYWIHDILLERGIIQK